MVTCWQGYWKFATNPGKMEPWGPLTASFSLRKLGWVSVSHERRNILLQKLANSLSTIPVLQYLSLKYTKVQTSHSTAIETGWDSFPHNKHETKPTSCVCWMFFWTWKDKGAASKRTRKRWLCQQYSLCCSAIKLCTNNLGRFTWHTTSELYRLWQCQQQ